MTKRGRAKDEYPEWIRERMLLPLLPLAGDSCATSAVLLADWVLPVELDLNQPTFIELNKLVANIKPTQCQHDSSNTTATAEEVALQRHVKFFVLNERRTIEPLLDDNAIVATFNLVETHRFLNTSAGTQNASYLDMASSQLRESRDYEDNRTGQGLLIAQPRLFLMAIESNSQTADVAHSNQTEIGIKMEFRLTDRVSSKEFFTEMIAKFS